MLEYNAELRDLMNRRDELVVTFMHSVDGLLFTAHEFSLALGLKPIDTNSWLTQLERDQNITRFIDAKTKSIYFISINTPPFEMYAVVPSSPKRLKTDKIVCQERHLILPLRTLLVNLQEELRMLVKAQKLIENDEIVRLELLCQKWKEASVAIFETIQTNWHEEIGLEDLMIAGGFNPEALEFESELKESSLYNLALSDGLGSSNRHNSGPMSSEDN